MDTVMLQCYYSKHLFLFWGHFCAWIYNDVSLLFDFDFFFFFFLVVGRESWAWEQTICNIFLDLLRTCFAWVLQSFQIAKVASRREFAWVYNDFPTRFVHFYVISHTRLGTLWEKLITKMSWMTVLKFALQKLSQLEYLNHVIWSISITIFKQWNKNEF